MATPLPVVDFVANNVEFCCPGPPVLFQGQIYFAASRNFGENQIGRELFVLDPATGTTNLFLDVNPGPDESSPESLTVFDDHLYFFSYSMGIWRTDGTVEGTMLVDDTLFSVSSTIEFDGALFASGETVDGSFSGFLRLSPLGSNGEDDDDEGENDMDDNDDKSNNDMPPAYGKGRGYDYYNYFYKGKGSMGVKSSGMKMMGKGMKTRY